MATIEPRLIHLLNDATTPQTSPADLPPLQTGLGPPSSDRPSPLEPDASQTQGENVFVLGQSQANPVLPPFQPEDSTLTRNISSRDNIESGGLEKNAAGSVTSYPIRMLLSDVADNEPSNSLSRILDDGTNRADDASTKKRQRGITVKDDFMQLPQPVKKPRAAQHQVMPPIINGLLEPPPDAALFPPISSNSFSESEVNQLKLLREYVNIPEDKPLAGPSRETPKPAVKTRRRAAKPRKKWTEEETNHLLRGVSRHGVGKWTIILEDKEFRFNDRTAGDLKDRFRTCCPEEMRAELLGTGKGVAVSSPPAEQQPKDSTNEPKHKAKTGLWSENILIDSDDEPGPSSVSQEQSSASSGPKQRKSRAHRKNMDDLAELGIHSPFRKSERRERRPFTEQDDQEILQGLDVYGPAWTKIQRDARFHLSNRQPTDLRDRVRNKYPNIYQRLEKTAAQNKEATHGSDLLEPVVNTMIENSLNMSIPAPLEGLRRGSVDETTKRDTEQPNEYSEIGTGHTINNSSEMDISRLLLDDTTDIFHSSRGFGSDQLSRPPSPLDNTGLRRAG